jgi:hypothetical protein
MDSGTAYEATHKCIHCNPDKPDLPANLEKLFVGFKNQVFGEFEVCPLEARREGHMQPARLIAAKRLTVRAY